MVYLTKEDWKNFFIPKLFEDNFFENEFKYIKNIFKIMTFINSKLKNSNSIAQIILSTSMIYFHKYYNQNLIILSNLTPIDKLIIAGSCIFLATKSTNHLLRVSNIVIIINDIIKIKFPNLKYDNELIKNMIFEKEFEILKSMEFCANIELPYKFIIKLKTYFEKNINISCNILIGNVCQCINNSFFFPMSLYYTPNTIAISCVKIIKEKFNLVDININNVISLSEYKIDLNELNECFWLQQKLFEKL
jgi:hypothetical protein